MSFPYLKLLSYRKSGTTLFFSNFDHSVESVFFSKNWAAVFLIISCPVFCILMSKKIHPNRNNIKEVFKEEVTLTAGYK